MNRRQPRSTRPDTLFPYTTRFRSVRLGRRRDAFQPQRRRRQDRRDPRTIARDREARFPAVRAAGHGGAGNPQGAGREVFLGLAKTRPQPFSRRREKGFGQHVGSRQELAAVAPPTRTSPSASRQPKGSACPANSRFDALRSACSISPTNASASPSSSNAATPRSRKPCSSLSPASFAGPRENASSAATPGSFSALPKPLPTLRIRSIWCERSRGSPTSRYASAYSAASRSEEHTSELQSL